MSLEAIDAGLAAAIREKSFLLSVRYRQPR
jgi:hypothetical protein